jgi:transcriptional regulator with XRE-family HTH domain
MGSTDAMDSDFRKNIRTERESRKWSQARVAKLLSDKGIDSIFTTTIAKIELGERPAKLNEAAALADVFGVSLDALIGRRRLRSGDKSLPLNALAKRTTGTAVAADALEAGLREHLDELQEFTLRRDEAAAVTECERAAEALGAAATVTRRAAAKLQRVQQRMQREFFADDSHDDEEN